MRSVGIKTLKNKLSEYIRLVTAGETVLVTDRDEVVAELIPPRGGRAATPSDALLAEAVRTGLVSPATMPPGPPPISQPVATLDEVLAELEEDRAER